MDEITMLDLAKVDPPGDAARDFIDPEKVRELAESIRELGLMEPIIARPVNGRFEVVIGHRRFLAHRLIGKADIKAIVRVLTDEEVILMRSVENDQREDLNPIERAKMYLRMREKLSMSDIAIAQKMGRHRNTIRSYLDLLEMPEEFQREVSRGSVSMEVARTLAQIDDPDFRKYYFQNAVENGVTVDVAKLWVNNYRQSRVGPAQGQGGGDGGVPSAQEVLPIYATCFACVGPCDVNKVKYIPVCPSCWERIRGALRDEGK